MPRSSSARAERFFRAGRRYRDAGRHAVDGAASRPDPDGDQVSSLDRSKGRGPGRKRLARKQAWYDDVTVQFADRIEPIDLPVAEEWGEISVRVPSVRDADKAIAATALAKDYAVAKENLGEFRRAGVALVDPFDPGTWDDDWDDDPIASLLRPVR